MTRGTLTAWLDGRWYGGLRPNLFLRALSTLFGALSALRRTLYSRGILTVVQLNCPVLVVGNLTVGGAGKTPLTQALVEGLRARGWRPGVISRGYGGSQKLPAVLPSNPDPQRFGDEPCLLAQRSGAPVAVARKRSEAGRLLLATSDVNVLVADDALQHYALARDIEIMVIDGQRKLGNGALLPAGPMREPASRGMRCDFRVINGGIDVITGAEWAMALRITRAVRLDGKGERSLESLAGQAVNAVAAIANPARFFAALAGKGVQATNYPFADHHAFTAHDFAFDDGRPLLMTEKDAVKCHAFAKPHWYAVPADPVLDSAFFDAVHTRLLACVESASRKAANL